MDPVNLSAAQAIAGLGALGASIYAIVQILKQAVGPDVTSKAKWARILPCLGPIIGGFLAPAIAHQWSVEGIPIPLLGHALAGVLAGFMSGGLYSAVHQTVMGKDARMEGPEDERLQ